MSYFNLKQFWDLSRCFDRQLQNILIQKYQQPTAIFRHSVPLVISWASFAASLGSFSLCLYGCVISEAPWLWE
jgi:hypothetical protein